MAGTAEQNFQQTTNMFRQAGEFIKQFLRVLQEVLNQYGENKRLREIAKYLEDGGIMEPYSIQGDKLKGVTPELLTELDAHAIPYLEVKGDQSMVLVREQDRPLIKSINKDILVQMGNYYQEFDAAQMEMKIAEAPEKLIPDSQKQIMTVHGLSSYEYEVIKNKCNNIGQGFMVGKTVNQDGTYDLSIQAKPDRVLSPETDRNDFCKSYAAAQLSLYGPNHDLKIKQIDADREFMESLDEALDNGGTEYVIGEDDKNHYLVLNDIGFEYHELQEAVDKDGMPVIADKVVSSCSKTDPDFSMELETATDQIMDKVLIADASVLNSHLYSQDQVVHSDRPNRDLKAATRSIAEKQIVAKVDTLIKQSLFRQARQEGGLGFKTPDMALEAYAKEFSHVMEAVTIGIVIDGYDAAKIEDIRHVFVQAGIDPAEYKNIPQMAANLSVETHRAARPIERAAVKGDSTAERGQA